MAFTLRIHEKGVFIVNHTRNSRGTEEEIEDRVYICPHVYFIFLRMLQITLDCVCSSVLLSNYPLYSLILFMRQFFKLLRMSQNSILNLHLEGFLHLLIHPRLKTVWILIWGEDCILTNMLLRVLMSFSELTPTPPWSRVLQEISPLSPIALLSEAQHTCSLLLKVVFLATLQALCSA